MKLVDAINAFFMHPMPDLVADQAYEGDQMDLEVDLDEEDLQLDKPTPVRSMREMSIEVHSSSIAHLNNILDNTRETLIKFQEDSARYVKSLEAKIADLIIVRDGHQAALNVITVPVVVHDEKFLLNAID